MVTLKSVCVVGRVRLCIAVTKCYMVFTSICLLCLTDKLVSTIVSAEPKYSHVLLTFRLFDIQIASQLSNKTLSMWVNGIRTIAIQLYHIAILRPGYVPRSGKSWSLFILVSYSWTPSICGPFSLPECMNPEAYHNPLPLDACTDLNLRCPARPTKSFARLWMAIPHVSAFHGTHSPIHVFSRIRSIVRREASISNISDLGKVLWRGDIVRIDI
jgi:hypothetical protein